MSVSSFHEPNRTDGENRAIPANLSLRLTPTAERDWLLKDRGSRLPSQFRSYKACPVDGSFYEKRVGERVRPLLGR